MSEQGNPLILIKHTAKKGDVLKEIKATHRFTNDRGRAFFGAVGHRQPNLVWFLPLCDGITWMKEPICVSGVSEINPSR